jgi:predicted ester cyclase
MKKLLCVASLVLLICFTFACQNKAAMAELKQMKAQGEVGEQNKALVKRYLEGLDSYNTEIFDEALSADCQIYFPGSFEPVSREQLKQLVTGFYKVFGNITHKLEDMISEGDKVLARTTDSATHTGEFMGIAPTGKTVKFGELHLFRIKEGKIAEYWIQEDFLWMNQQLGMELKPKEVKKLAQ